MSFKFFYLLIFFLIFESCSTTIKSDHVTHDNLEEKIQKAFLKSEFNDDTESLIPVLFFIDKNNIVFNDVCILSKVYYLRAIKYRTVNNDEEFLKYANLAVQVAEKCHDNTIKSVSNNLLGIFYHINKNFSLSIKYYKKAISYGEKNTDKSFIIDIYINLCKLYVENKNWYEVIDYAKKGIILSEKDDVKKVRLRSFYTLLAESYMNIGQYDLAVFNLSQGIKIIKESKANNFLIDSTKSYREIYLIFAELSKKQNKLNLAYKYMKASDSLSVLVNQENRDKISKFLEAENDLENKLLVSKQKVIFNHRIILIGCVLFLLISFFLIYKSKKFSDRLKTLLKEKEELNTKLLNNYDELEEIYQKLKLKKVEIEGLLKFNEQTLLTKTLKISNYKDAVNNVIKKINYLIEDKKSIPSNKMHSVNRSLQLIISEEDIWEDFKIQFEKNRPNFFKKLLKIVPDLSVVNQKHCAYVAINLRSKEVANILNLSTRSVETTRYRIKKKLKIEKESLQEFLNKL
ncbi:hypothetical protein [Polaribacter sp. Asnod1-A03]|uniref:tetratricopeptide repeat protein n=1 Tax=Polaribacter sp. Asnod1-A03 TaxID=3160581 RepID=UPI00386FD507